MTQIPKDNKIHYAIFPDKYFVADDIFLLKKKQLSTAQRAGGWVIINEIVCDSRVLCLWV